VAERDRLQPVDADVDVGGAFLPAGRVDGPCRAARRCRRRRRRSLTEEPLQALDAGAGSARPPPSRGSCRSPRSTPARAGGTTGCSSDQAAGHRERARGSSPRSRAAGGRFATTSDAGPAPIKATRLPFLTAGARGSRRSRPRAGRRDALQTADRNRLLLDRPRRQAGSQADRRSDEDAGEDVRLAIEHVRVRVPPLRDQPGCTRATLVWAGSATDSRRPCGSNPGFLTLVGGTDGWILVSGYTGLAKQLASTARPFDCRNGGLCGGVDDRFFDCSAFGLDAAEWHQRPPAGDAAPAPIRRRGKSARGIEGGRYGSRAPTLPLRDADPRRAARRHGRLFRDHARGGRPRAQRRATTQVEGRLGAVSARSDREAGGFASTNSATGRPASDAPG